MSNDTLNNKYSFNVFWSEEDEAYIVTCLEFPLLSAFGDNPEEAIAEMQIALRLTVETYQEEGWVLPEPKVHKPDAVSGQIR